MKKKKRGKKMKKKMFRSRISFSTISPFAAVSLRGVAGLYRDVWIAAIA